MHHTLCLNWLSSAYQVFVQPWTSRATVQQVNIQAEDSLQGVSALHAEHCTHASASMLPSASNLAAWPMWLGVLHAFRSLSIQSRRVHTTLCHDCVPSARAATGCRFVSAYAWCFIKQHLRLNWCGCTGRRLLERWTLSYAQAPASEAQHRQQGRSSASRLEPASVYKRMVIAMRSLYSYVRVLPTYRLYKACAVSTHPLLPS